MAHHHGLMQRTTDENYVQHSVARLWEYTVCEKTENLILKLNKKIPYPKKRSVKILYYQNRSLKIFYCQNRAQKYILQDTVKIL